MILYPRTIVNILLIVDAMSCSIAVIGRVLLFRVERPSKGELRKHKAVVVMRCLSYDTA